MVGRKKLFLIVMLIISSILMTISLFGPWYSTKMAYEEKYDGGSDSDKRILDYHFTESQFHHELSGESRLYPGETNELPDNIVSYSSIGFRDKQKFVSTMETAQNLALIGLLFAYPYRLNACGFEGSGTMLSGVMKRPITGS